MAQTPPPAAERFAGSRQPQFLYRLPDGQYLYVSADPGDPTYETFRLFVGPASDLRPVPIQSVERRRDGGTTRIESDAGTLHQPAPRKRLPPTWNGGRIEPLNPQRYTVEETDSRVMISQPPPWTSSSSSSSTT